MDNIIALAKRRGFIYPSSEIYGGLANTWDFGHYGTLLKNNIRDRWWKTFVLDHEDMVGVDASVFLNPQVWQASGHVAGFTDALVDCKNCHRRTRADHLIEDSLKNDTKVEGLSTEKLTAIIKNNKLKCPTCGSADLTEVRKFNLLFETQLGIVEEKKAKVYLRGEIAQGIFMNFKNVLDTMRVKIPFGIAQVGKAYRNEITLGQFVHRTLEFDLMEFEYFIRPETWQKTYDYWRQEMWNFALLLGLAKSKLRWREHEEFERSHYSKKTMDIEYEYPFGFKEMFGIAYRTDFDLSNHAKHSGRDLQYRDARTGDKFTPHVIEPTFGLSRLVGIVLINAYHEEEVNGIKRLVLRLEPRLAPVKIAVFPPYCLTVDFQTKEDNAVTVRHRDTMQQERIGISELKDYFAKLL
ncbi:glycine--tRNA ligase [Candidatus Roizmanbacteria bacterium]|nr:glycine--tRNA ligase [Candidatus Roizmanbacteria bacterium]